MADAAVTFLLEKAEQLQKYYVDLVSGAENELEQLRNDLGLLKAFLRDAANTPKKVEPYRELERQIREVVYDAEDTIDSWLTHAAASKGTSSFLRRHLNPKRVSLGKEIKSLREDKLKPTIDKVMMDFANLQIGDGSGTSVEQPLTKVKEAQAIRQDNIVGFEDEEEIIINHLMEKTEELDVISIIGMPGLGKTTLAWKIYKNSQIEYEFPIRIWVYVSQEFDIRDVLLTILKEFTRQDMSSMSDNELAQTARACLERGNFLLVMDDVWTVEAWNRIQHALPKSNWRGKVLITSRDKNVGNHANVTRKPHMLRFLNEEESWQLLQLQVFGQLGECPKELEEMGKYIAKQCDGLPLAIVMIGRVLVEHYSTTREMSQILNAWNSVSRDVRTHIEKDKYHNVSDILALSYNNLPDYLRHCFLYLGVFPEEYEIPVWTLTRLWIGEGFIQHKEGKSLEEIAEENVKDLIDMNLVMVDRRNPKGEPKTCHVHEDVRRFCISKAAMEEPKLFTEIKQSNKGVFDLQNQRRLCIHSNLLDFLSELLSGKVLMGPGAFRSFLCFYKEPFVLNPKYISTIPDSFILLRVLDSNSFKLTEFPSRVTRLIHLRYITFSCDDLTALPKELSDLWNLQTLVVDTKSRRLEIKANIWKMIQLRHLKTKAEIILAIKGEGEGGENLQTLTRLSPENCTDDVFNRTRNLNRLGIRGRLAVLLDDKCSLVKLDRLENLKLVNDLYDEAASEKPLHHLPRENFFPRDLKKLTLSATYLDWKHMSTLGTITTLEVLKLKDNAFIGQSWLVDGCFHSLQFLLLETTDLTTWVATSDDHFLRLSCLVLKNCEHLEEIPLGLAKSLQILNIERVPKSAVLSAKKIEEKKEELLQVQQKGRHGGFKLSIGPGCE